jgi:chromatin remodeling complex protein RSC6
MARQTKTKAETEQVQTASATTTVPVVAPKEKKVKVSKTPKVVATSTSEVAPVVDPVEVAPAVVVDSEVEAPIAEQSVEFIAKLQQASVLLSSLKNEFRTLEKKWSRELKIAQKQSSKRKRKAGNRAPSGFVKPTRISDELAKFLDKPVGTEMARTEVTRDINKYIRAHSLQDNENGRKINPDTKLAALLKLTKTDELTYFNLQKYMSCHFAKATKEVGATA